MKFYTSDIHADHFNVIKLSHRPFNSIEELQSVIITNWNNKVSDGDDVYILGDSCFKAKTLRDMLPKLNGVKHLLRGNHDYKEINKLEILSKVPENKKEFKNVFFHGDLHSINDDGRHVVLCHYPIHEWHNSLRGSIHLHGHCHGNIGLNFKENAYEVGVDARNYEPVTLDEILNWEFSRYR